MTLQNLFGDLALDASVQDVDASVQQAVTLLTTLNNLATTIGDNTDQVESLLAAIEAAALDGDNAALEALVTTTNGLLATIGGYTDNVETLIASTNSALATLHADVDGIEPLLTAIDGHVDTVETLIAATNSTLSTIDGHVDGLETTTASIDAKATSTNTKLDTLHTDVDGLEALIGATNSTLATIQGFVDGLETLVAATNAAIASSNTKLDTLAASLSIIDGHVDGLETLVGATNTALGTMQATLTSISGFVDQIEGFTDGIETLIGTTNTTLTSTNTKLDTVITDILATNTKIDAVNANLVLIEGYTDGVEALITSTNALITSTNTFVDGVEALIGATNTVLVNGTQHTQIVNAANAAIGQAVGVPIYARAGGSVDAGNTTVTNLGAGAVFTGAWTDTSDVSDVCVGVASSHVSATDGLAIQWSDDAVNIRDVDNFTISANANNGQGVSLGPKWRYYRVVYTNGATLTTTLAIQSILKYGHSRASTHRLGDTLSKQQDAELTVSIPQRVTQLSDRTAVNAVLNDQAADATLYTVTAGKTLYVTSMTVSIRETAAIGGSANFALRAGVGGAIKKSFSLSDNDSVNMHMNFSDNPISFAAATVLTADIASGSITYSMSIEGYEE